MIRVVLTVLVAVALLGASLPALESARSATTVERLDSESDRLERAVASVTAESVAVGDPALAARTTVRVRAPSGLTAAPLARLALVDSAAHTSDSTEATDARGTAETPNAGGVTDTDVALLYRIDGGPDRTVSIVPDTTVATADVVDGPVELRPNGQSRLELRFVDDEGPTVRISRAG